MTAKVEVDPLLDLPVHDDTLRSIARELVAAVHALFKRPLGPVPFRVAVGHWTATAANTAYPAALSGLGQVWQRPIQQIIVSTSVAGLVVIGTEEIVPGQAADGELYRVHFGAAGTYTIAYGAGLPRDAYGGQGQRIFWSDTAGLVVDVQVIYG